MRSLVANVLPGSHKSDLKAGVFDFAQPHNEAPDEDHFQPLAACQTPSGRKRNFVHEFSESESHFYGGNIFSGYSA